jgi:uncharacterized circularly permuted ATP-grasp superfamily protein
MGEAPQFFDEMDGFDGNVRAPYEAYSDWLEEMSRPALLKKSAEAQAFFRRTGITFNVYGDAEADERLIPFDLIPRIIGAGEWANLVRGIEQRVKAINAFLHDIYHRQEIIRAGRVPERLIRENDAFLPSMIGMDPPGGIYTHIVGVDLVRTGPNEFFVLEDNARTPSGVSYMLENRETMLKMFPELFSHIRVEPVQQYPATLRGLWNSAARQPRMETGRLWLSSHRVSTTLPILNTPSWQTRWGSNWWKGMTFGWSMAGSRCGQPGGMNQSTSSIAGSTMTSSIPLNFRSDSLLGVAGIFDIYPFRGITIANAPGTGIADDKAIYSYMPEIVEFYTGQKPILQNVPTWRCAEKDALAYVLDNLEELVVKEVHGSGGYGMLVGPAASKTELKTFRAKLTAKPENYIAQPTLALSTVPVLTKSGLAPRHVDLRPFVLVSPEGVEVTPGGLTRVAMKKGSLVVNSSQGGGTKDTWVLKGDYR